MVRRTGRALPGRVEAVRRRIEHWRETREKRTRMPEGLWGAAVSVAHKHGLWAVSRALRLNYECLKGRCARAKGVVGGGGGKRSTGFVELDAGQLVSSRDETMTLVELTRGDGAKLTIRVGGGESVDVSALADAFWRRGR